MHSDLAGKRALITGSSQGIGEAVARTLAMHGVRVVVHGRTHANRAEAIAESIRQSGGEAELVTGDLADAGACARIVDEAAERLGGLDIVINNAGSHVAATSGAVFTAGTYDEIVQTNVRSVLAVTAASHRHLKAAGNGSIINTGSIAARHGGKVGSSTYAAAKAAVHSITRSAAKEFGVDHIRVNTVAPGVILTPFHETMPEAARSYVAGLTSLGRLGTADDCTGAYLFFASDRMSGYVTGQIIDVNGGWYMP